MENYQKDEIVNKIRNLPKYLEKLLDELLPDSYAYLQNYVQTFCDNNSLNLDSYEIKQLLSHSFRTINTVFLPYYEEFIIDIIKQIIRQLEDNNDIEKTLINMEYYSSEEIDRKFLKSVNLGLMKFSDEFNYNYVRRINSDEIRYLSRTLIDRIEDVMKDNKRMINKSMRRQFEEIIEMYKYMKRNEIEKQESSARDLSYLIIKIYEEHQKEIEENEETKIHFENLKNFIISLNEQNKSLDTLDAWDQAILDDLKNKMILSINENQNENSEEIHNKTKH